MCFLVPCLICGITMASPVSFFHHPSLVNAGSILCKKIRVESSDPFLSLVIHKSRHSFLFTIASYLTLLSTHKRFFIHLPKCLFSHRPVSMGSNCQRFMSKPDIVFLPNHTHSRTHRDWPCNSFIRQRHHHLE